MSQEQEFPQQLPVAPFPAPPPFWKHFTTTNVARYEEWEAQNKETDTTPSQPASTDPPRISPSSANKKLQGIPTELIYLRPPPPPPTSCETYSTFNIPQSLQPANAQLPPTEFLLIDLESLLNTNSSDQSAPGEIASDDIDENTGEKVQSRLLEQDAKTSIFTSRRSHAAHLSVLTDVLMFNFLELNSILGVNPASLYQEKLDAINRIMINIHAVINLYRPHQAREGVKDILKGRIEDAKEEIERCDEMKKKIESFLAKVEGEKLSASNADEQNATVKEEVVPGAKQGNKKRSGAVNGHNADLKDERREETRRLWATIHELDDD